MKILFWLCIFLTAYAYLGYPLVLGVIARYRTRPVLRKKIAPTLSIIIAARNEEHTLRPKLESLRRQNYPMGLVQTIVVSDGSTDATADFLREQRSLIESVILETPCGKAAALNEAVKRATGEILVFMDARQAPDPNALSELAACFWDPEVGGASGELILNENSASSAGALGTYWNFEKYVRRLESATGSVIGTTGALYAVRRRLYTPVPPGTILDDVVIPMNVVRQGMRVILQPSAIARDKLFTDKGKEFRRKVRTMTGNYQLLWLAPWLLSPSNPVLLRYVSHKFLRLLCPWLLILMTISAGLSAGRLYQFAFAAQAFVYAMAAFGTIFPTTRRLKVVAVIRTFVMLNVAAALGLYNVVVGRNPVWR